MPVGRGQRPRLQIPRRADQDFPEDRLDKLHLLRFQRLLLRMFRKPWWQSSFRHEFETRSHTRLLAATRRGFTFYVTDPLSSIHEFTLIYSRTNTNGSGFGERFIN